MGFEYKEALSAKVGGVEDNFELHTHTCRAKVDRLMGGHFDHGQVNDFLL